MRKAVFTEDKSYNRELGILGKRYEDLCNQLNSTYDPVEKQDIFNQMMEVSNLMMFLVHNKQVFYKEQNQERMKEKVIDFICFTRRVIGKIIMRIAKAIKGD